MDRRDRARGLRVLRATLAALTLLGFETVSSRSRAYPEPTAAATPDPKFGQFGLLETQVTQARRQNCWSLTVRGKLTNPYDAKVEGVRLIVRLRQSGEESKTVERIESAISLDIEPHGSVNFSRNLDTGCTATFHDVAIVAFAGKLGGSELGAPDLDLEVAATRFQEAVSPGSSVAPLAGSAAVSVY